jgi:hypothetical protein
MLAPLKSLQQSSESSRFTSPTRLLRDVPEKAEGFPY